MTIRVDPEENETAALYDFVALDGRGVLETPVLPSENAISRTAVPLAFVPSPMLSMKPTSVWNCLPRIDQFSTNVVQSLCGKRPAKERER